MYFKVVISMEKFVSNLSKCYTVITRYEPALHPLANQPPPPPLKPEGHLHIVY